MEDGILKAAMKMPTTATTTRGRAVFTGEDVVTKDKVVTAVDAVAIADWVRQQMPVDEVVIEDVNARPDQGVQSAFTFGRVTGLAEGVATGVTRVRARRVAPASWKSAMAVTADKKTSLARCRQLWPERAREFTRVTVDDGVAEAALIAVWAQTHSPKGAVA